MMDFLRIACAVPRVSLGDPKANAREMAGRWPRQRGRTRTYWYFRS